MPPCMCRQVWNEVTVLSRVKVVHRRECSKMSQKHLERIQAKLKEARPVVAQVFKQGISVAGTRVSSLQKEIDDFFKITDVKDAQSIVTDSERKFLEARSSARESKQELEQAEQLLQGARKKVDRCPRDDSENYLACVSEERAVWVRVQDVKRANQEFEHAERELFTEYSNAVRISHEKERERAQKTRYWSIIGSIVGTVVGFLGSSMLTLYRLNQIKQIASPDLVVNELRDEIRQQGAEQAELQKSFEVNTQTLINGLEQKIHLAGIKRSNDELVILDNDVLYRTEELIENSKIEMKGWITKASEDLSQLKDNFRIDLHSILSESVHKTNKETGVLLNHSFNEQNKKIGENISAILSNTSEDLASKTCKCIQMEMKKLSENMQLMSEQTDIAKRELKNIESITPITPKSEALDAYSDWKNNLNLTLSVLSFSMLLFLMWKN